MRMCLVSLVKGLLDFSTPRYPFHPSHHRRRTCLVLVDDRGRYNETEKVTQGKRGRRRRVAGKPLPQQAAWPSVLPRLLLLVLSFRWYQQRGIGGAGHCPSRSAVGLSGRCWCPSVRTHRQTIEAGAIAKAMTAAHCTPGAAQDPVERLKRNLARVTLTPEKRGRESSLAS